MMRALLQGSVAAAVIVVVGAAGPGPSVGPSSGGGVVVSDPWFRLITPQVPAGGYMTIRNGSGRAVTLTGASSPGCGMVMLHRTEGERMVMIPAAPIAAGGTLTLSPGGYHLMCMSPHMTVGATVPVTLTFADGATAATVARVIGATGHPPHTGD